MGVKVELNLSCEGVTVAFAYFTHIDRHLFPQSLKGSPPCATCLTIFIFSPAPSLSLSHTAENVLLCTSFFPTSCITVNLQDSNFCLHIAIVCHLQKMSFSTIHSLLLIESCPCILSPCCKTISGLVHKAVAYSGNFVTHL